MRVNITLNHVRDALALENFDVVDAQLCMAPQARPIRRPANMSGQARRASVLVLLFPTSAGLSLVLLRRAYNPRDVHSGQISLPGGSREGNETPVQTALRETREELGVTEAVEILGTLGRLYVPPSDFEVRPVVGDVPARPLWQPGAGEVCDVLECPLQWLLDDAHKASGEMTEHGHIIHTPWYDVRGYRVWGATAIILSEFEQRLRRVLRRRPTLR